MMESTLKSKMAAEINATGNYARRFEDKFLIGFPDMMVIIRHLPVVFFIEAKMITSSTFEPRARQYLELERLGAGGVGIPLLLGFRSYDEAYLSPLVVRARIADSTQKRPGEKYVDFISRFYKERHVRQS
jgi:hypothetical protein